MRSTCARILISISLAFAAGCGGVEARSTVAVKATGPDLAYAGPGVRVIVDYDEAIFYSEGFYWWFVGDSWHRSSSYTSGWALVANPPPAILQIRDPHRYRHYMPIGYVVERRPVPVRLVQRPIRDHRR